MARSPQRRGGYQAVGNTASTIKKRQGGNSNKKRASTASQLEAMLREHRADRKERDRQEQRRAKRESLTIVGLFVTALLAGLNLMQLQSQFIDTQRAWLAIDEVKIGSAMTFSKTKGATIKIEFLVTNKGQTPATRIEASVTDCHKINCLIPEKNDFAAYLRSADTITEMVLFQNEQFTVHRTISIPREEMQVINQPGGRVEVWFNLFVGVGYLIVGDTRRHVTAIPYGVIQLTMEGEELVIRDPVSLNPSQLFMPIVD
ncbi:MAG: hypothetical protein ACRECF_08095 [Methyloceanibacter sp.]